MKSGIFALVLTLGSTLCFGRGGELGNARVYDNGAIGIRFQYPRDWSLVDLGTSVHVGLADARNTGSSAAVVVDDKPVIQSVEDLRQNLLLQTTGRLVATSLDGRPGFEVQEGDADTQRTVVLIEGGRVGELRTHEGQEIGAHARLESVRSSLSFSSVSILRPAQ